MGSLVGESEANMRKCLEIAEAVSPALLWVDELEKSFAGTKGNQAHEVTEHVFQEFLTWLQENWGELSQAIRPHNRMVEALLKSCEPVSIQDEVVMLGFYHSFHRDKVNEDHHRAAVEEGLRELSGQPLRVRCSLIGGDRAQKEQQREASHREELINGPVVQEAIKKLGARVVDTQ